MIELTKLERQMIKTLAEEGPLSGYDFHLGGRRQRGPRKALMSSGYWQKVKEHLGPEGLNLIKPVNLRRYKASDQRGRRKDPYWLTEEGILSAVLNHANLRRLRRNVKNVYGEIENYEALFDMVEVVGPEKMRGIVDLSQQYKTKAQIPDYLVVAPHTIIDNEKQIEKLSRRIKKYPNVKKDYADKLRRTCAKLEKVEKYLRA